MTNSKFKRKNQLFCMKDPKLDSKHTIEHVMFVINLHVKKQ